MRPSLRLALAGLVSIAAAAAGQQLTERDFLRGIDAAHPALAELRAELARAEAARIAAETFADPSLSVEREAPRGEPRQTTASVSWAPALARRSAAVTAALAGEAAARAALDAGVADLRRRAREAWA